MIDATIPVYILTILAIGFPCFSPVVYLIATEQ